MVQNNAYKNMYGAPGTVQKEYSCAQDKSVGHHSSYSVRKIGSLALGTSASKITALNPQQIYVGCSRTRHEGVLGC